MTNPIIQLTDISASYDEKTVLSHVNLTVYERDFLGVIGPNGGGKTTLIKIILGLLKPASGSVRFYKNEKEVPEIAMGYLPQYNSIDKKFPISVYEVVLSGLNKQKSLFHRYTPRTARTGEPDYCPHGTGRFGKPCHRRTERRTTATRALGTRLGFKPRGCHSGRTQYLH